VDVHVMSRGQAQGASFTAPWAVISIKGSDQSLADAEFCCPNLTERLYLAFDDIDHLKEGMVAFDLATAAKIWNFVGQIQEQGIQILLVHCLMGASRSPAIAAAVDRVLLGTDSHWFKSKVPNRRVYRLMLHAAEQRGLRDES